MNTEMASRSASLYLTKIAKGGRRSRAPATALHAPAFEKRRQETAMFHFFGKKAASILIPFFGLASACPAVATAGAAAPLDEAARGAADPALTGSAARLLGIRGGIRSHLQHEDPPRTRDCLPRNGASSTVMVSDEDVTLMIEPALGAPPVTDRKHEPLRLDPRNDLKILEEKNDWLRVSVMSPNWPPNAWNWSGWIRREQIRRVETPDEKACLLVDVLNWKDAPADKLFLMRETALRILREDSRCGRIARGGAIANGQRYYFTCYPADGGRPYHYWMSLLSKDRAFTLPAPVDENTAMNMCREELEKVARARAMIEGRAMEEIRINGLEARPAPPVHYLKIDYQLDAEARVANCFVAPGQKAEITLD